MELNLDEMSELVLTFSNSTEKYTILVLEQQRADQHIPERKCILMINQRKIRYCFTSKVRRKTTWNERMLSRRLAICRPVSPFPKFPSTALFQDCKSIAARCKTQDAKHKLARNGGSVGDGLLRWRYKSCRSVTLCRPFSWYPQSWYLILCIWIICTTQAINLKS